MSRLWGKDRFIIWEQEGRYYCRQCNAAGDAIQFCRDFMNMDFRSACQKLGVEKERSSSHYTRKKFVPSFANLPSEIWQTRAMQFVQYCHKNLIEHSQGVDFLNERGLSIDTTKQYLLGWNPQMLLDTKERWGLPMTQNANGEERKQWLPHGFVIPTFQNDKLIKIKVRRNNPKEDDKLPKYVEISGSMKAPSFFGDVTKPIVLVEAEIDAVLIQQEAGELCCSLALGGASKKPDEQTHEFLMKAKLILFALDYDEAGKKAYRFWRGIYPALRAWPVPREKSPGDAHLAGLNLHQWVQAGLTKHL